MRKDLAAFAAQGLSDEQHEQLVDKIEGLPEDADEHLLLPFPVVGETHGIQCRPAARNEQLICIFQ